MLAKIQKLKNKKGFTLVELIVVIAIIAILAAVLIPVIGNYVAEANTAADDENKTQLKNAIATEISEMGNLGGTLKGVTSISVSSDGTAATVTVNASASTYIENGDKYKTTNSAASAEAAFVNNLQVRLAGLKEGTYTVTFGTLNGDSVIQSVS